MDAEREWMDAQGYKVYDHAGDAVGMTEEEKYLMDLRSDLAKMVRKRREELGVSPKELAKRLKVAQAKLVRIELGMWDIPLEQILHALWALGGRVAITELPHHSRNGTKNGALTAQKKTRATA